MFVFFRRKNAGLGGKLRSRNFAAHRARGDLHLRIVTDALRFPHVTASHHVELPGFLSKPHWSWNSRAGFSKGRQRDVLLSRDCGGNLACHAAIV